MNAYMKEFAKDARPLFIGLVLAADVVAAVVLGGLRGYHLSMLYYFLGGLLFFFIIEYFIHRFILHGLMKIVLPKAYEGHVQHHIEPTEMKYLLTPNLYNIPGYIAVWVVGWLLTRNVPCMAAFVVGTSLSQLNYEWTHFVSHRPIIPRTRWGKWMKKFHLLHHYKNENYWFGVTHPTMDILFHTDPDRDSVPKVDPPTELPARHRGLF
ncbi:sterol desaturase family protein [Alicyclobacillus cycloheptanicus]|uniref:Fatty acid hydroxylase domain-containing protein n=1 Tax=Alicyclobacillus cycloheptanicus TaxID=1457 RepID=A0ABT9XDY0_9BACL|nr:sterol desaturase family protein [Alicyclobacillus cycloheptanicus]MDQ0188284.1 hypothetical protein [Alicyclobacillus cycloheptanicus]WDM01002.1 sterol desaturase family protein [Alicyclobacillus cycloheptanicus]